MAAGKATIEAKSSDDAWYPCSLKLKGKHVHVHFLDYDSDEDESWQLDEFKTREDVLNRVRVTSEQLQDEECTNVCVGIQVCALKDLKDEQKYFDAAVLKITKQKHTKAEDGDEECKCKFTVQWKGGPAKGEIEDLDCSAITTLCDRNPEEHPELRAFLEKVTSQGSARNSRTPTRKRKSGSSRTPNSARKKVKAATNGSSVVKDQRELKDKKQFEAPTTQMTEKDIFSTINEVCDACQPNNSDAESKHPLEEEQESEKGQDGGKIWSATGNEEVHEESLLRPRGKTMHVGISQSPIPDATEASGDETLGNKSSSDHNISKRSSGQQDPVKTLTSSEPLGSQGQGPAQVSAPDFHGHATPSSAAVPEQGAAPPRHVVLISDDDDDDGESHTQRSPQPNGSNLKAAIGQHAQTSDGVGNASEEMEQRLSDMKKICSGLWPVDCILRIDNVEKDLCPQLAKTFLSAMLQDVISVFLFPSGENETSSFGFVVFKDSQAAENALQLVTSKCIVASQRQRPWSVSRAKISTEERELIAFTARGSRQASLNNTDSAASTSHQTTQLRWVLPEMKEYKLVIELLELHSAHRKQLQALWKSFNREEAAKRLQTTY